MSEDRLAETLARIDTDLLGGEERSGSVSAETIRTLHHRRRTRERSIVLGSLGFAAVIATVVLRDGTNHDVSNDSLQSIPFVSNEATRKSPPAVPVEPVSKPDFEVATVADPAMNFQLEMVRESIAENLVNLARLSKSVGNPESDWRQNLDFVLKNYPGTIAAESARIEFGTVSETQTH
jgi:hypothetical protein